MTVVYYSKSENGVIRIIYADTINPLRTFCDRYIDTVIGRWFGQQQTPQGR